MLKEILKPKMTRMHDSMKEYIQKSADKYNEGVFDRELRDLIRIGLKMLAPKEGRKKINTGL
jgi:hypothetical protein